VSFDEGGFAQRAWEWLRYDVFTKIFPPRCRNCRCQFRKADGCIPVPVRGLKPIAYGSETWDYLLPEELLPRCADCNAKLGCFHHPGCDKEQCPRCEGQVISCGCLDLQIVE